MADRWIPNKEGEQALLAELAAGASNFANYVVEQVKEVEGGKERSTFGGRTHYRDTITQTTYLNGAVVSGRELAGIGASRSSIRSIVYTGSFLGHMLEITGAKPHDIVTAKGEVIHHPGFNRRPHFVPGLLRAVSQVGAKMRGHVKTGALRPPPTRPPVGG
jgi:hypothetical protein